jgi:hypothetical protein
MLACLAVIVLIVVVAKVRDEILYTFAAPSTCHTRPNFDGP